MKFSYNWIRELTPGLTATPEELARLITMKTAECEGVESYAPYLNAVVAARVVEVERFPGKHIVRTIIDAGPKHGRKQVVCGAPNCREGIVTAFVPAGTDLPGKPIRKAVVGGIESDGMLASASELEISREDAGIMELTGVEPGASLPGCVPDFVIEIDNKSITNRPDLWGHLGMAREVAALTGATVKDPVELSALPDLGNDWNVEIEDHALSPRYSALVFDNVKVGPSPLWLQSRLQAIGLNPISNIVDVTNLLLSELPQPMHAFDADKLNGKTIFVRRAKEGEKLAALNGETYTLATSNLVIADAGGPIALAGVIGGADSAISASTTRIVLESANFEAVCIRKTSSMHKLRTDASMRYEKAQDPANTTRALARAIGLLQQVCPGIRLVGGLIDNYRGAAAARVIDLPLSWIERKLGCAVPPAQVRAYLEPLGFKVDVKTDDCFAVTVPSWRATKDITIKEDLLEEIGRMIGYANVPPAPPLRPATQPWINAERFYHHRVADACAAQGFSETLNYSFISEEMATRFGFAPDAHVHVLNPISVEQSLMRMSLLPGMHRAIVENAKRFDECRLFEIGFEIHKTSTEAGKLPNEVPHLMASVYAKEGDGSAALYELKRLAECLLPGCEVAMNVAMPVAGEACVYEHPARRADVSWRGTKVGRLFELHPSFVEVGRAAVLDVDLGAVYALGAQPKRYTPLNKYPSTAFDLSVVTGLRELSGELGKKIRTAAGAHCELVEFLYSYRGKPLADDKQSLTYRVTLTSSERTLSSEEAGEVRASIINALKASGYELRL